MREFNIMPWSEEVKLCINDNKEYIDEDSMIGARVKFRAQHRFKNPVGNSAISLEALRHASNRLESLQYNIPLYISGTTTATMEEMQEVSFNTSLIAIYTTNYTNTLSILANIWL